VSKPSTADHTSDNPDIDIEDEEQEYNPCGINENVVNEDDMKAMNECMMNIYLDDDYKQQDNQDNDEEEEQLDQDMLNKINLSSNNANDNQDQNNFNGDIQQFNTFLEERLGTETLAKIKELIKK